MARFNTQSITTSVTGAGTVASPQAFTALNGTAPYTVTLPSPVLFPGSSQTFYNATSGTVTLSTPSGLFSGLGASGAGTLAIPTNSVVSVTSDGTNYVVLSEDGSALVATTGSFTSNVTANGASATVSLTPQTVTIAPTGASTIDNVNIGVSTRGSGAFNTLTANSAVTFTANTTSSSTGTGTLVVTGGVGVSGAVYAAGLNGPLTGTVQTAAQPNITSTGSLTVPSLTVNGVSSLNGRTTAKDTINTDTSYPFGIQNGSQQPWWIRALTTSNKFVIHLNGTGDLVTVDTTGSMSISASSGAGGISVGSNADRAQYQYINFGGGAGGSDYAWQVGRSPSGGVGPADGFYIYDIKANATRVSINGSGNVGIGTTGPTAPLTITDGATPNGASTGIMLQIKRNVSNGAGIAGTGIQFGNNSNGFNIRYGGTTDRLWFQDGGNVEVLSLLNGGNVGIGTSAPAGILDVGDNRLSSNTYFRNNGAYGSGGGGQTTLNVMFGGVPIAVINNTGTGQRDGQFRLYDENVTKVNIVANSARGGPTYFNAGNVGIGSTTPQSILDVRSYTAGTTIDNGVTLWNPSGANDTPVGIRLSTYGDETGNQYPKQFIGAIRNGLVGAGNGSIVFCNRDANDASIVTLADERMRILPGGNVGIGKTNPGYKLDVNGIIRSGSVELSRVHTDIMKMWRTADLQGYTTQAADGGGISYTWDNGMVLVDSSVGSHNWDIGKINLSPGVYQLVLVWRPSPTAHGWSNFGSNSNGHTIRLQSDAAYGSYNTFLTVDAPSINKDLGYSITYASGTYTVASQTTYRIGMGTQPYNGGGYKYYVEAAYLMRLT